METYYKTLRDFVDYKSGAMLVLNPHIETDIVNAQGQRLRRGSVIRKKVTGKINGWVGYTYSRSLVQVNLPPPDMINGGNWYPSNYDKPHDCHAGGQLPLQPAHQTWAELHYSTGRPITLPLAKYYIDNSLRVLLLRPQCLPGARLLPRRRGAQLRG